MKNTKFSINNKKLPLMSVGCMRFSGCENAVETIRRAVLGGATYLDTSPGYCYSSSEENTEVWTGKAIKGIRDKVILSAKCSSGNGGFSVDPQPNFERGFSIVTESQLQKEIEQSMKRLDVDHFDCYQLWAVHSDAIFEKAMEKGGWIDGALKAQRAGLFKELGMTGHGTNKDWKKYIDSGCFSIVTLPFNLFDITRLDAVNYAISKNIKVIAMNPLAGGMLANLPKEKSADFLKKHGFSSIEEFAVRFINAFEASALMGVSSKEQSDFDTKLFDKECLTQNRALELRKEFLSLSKSDKFTCTGCGYCMPCPQGLNISRILTLRNLITVFDSQDAKNALIHQKNHDEEMDFSRCTNCKACETKCPNSVKATELFSEIEKLI